MYRLFSSLAIAVVIALAAPAAAAPPSGPGDEVIDAYREAVADGVALFSDGKYEAAREAFKDAYAMHPAPVLIFNIASTYRREGDIERALAYYRRFTAEAADGDPRLALARETIDHLETIQRERAELAAQPEEDAATEQTELPSEQEAPALSPGALDPRDEPRDRPGLSRRRVGLALLGVGGTSIALAGVEALRAHRIASDLRSLADGTPWDPQQQDRYEDIRSARNRAIGLSVVGAAVSVTGALLYRRGRVKQRNAVAITPTAGPRFVGVVGRVEY